MRSLQFTLLESVDALIGHYECNLLFLAELIDRHGWMLESNDNLIAVFVKVLML